MFKSVSKIFSDFSYLNSTQFLGSLNDNLYKLFLVFYLIDLQGIDHADRILALAGMTFVLPYLLFSPLAGILADRFKKRTIIVATKIFEVFAILCGLISFFFVIPWLGYFALFFMGLQSAIFGPSKYGIIPEIVPAQKISKANGIVSSFTYLAVILGTFLASLLTQLSQRHVLLAATSCLLVAILGLFTSLYIPQTPAAGSEKKLSLNFLSDVAATLRRARKQEQIAVVIFCGVFFLFSGAFVQLNIIPFAMQVLNLPDVGGGYLFLITALGIGMGSLISGKISGKNVELGLVPPALIGITFFFLLLSLGIKSLIFNGAVLVLLGASAGVYLVPLDAYIQTASNDSERGQNVAANNFMGFMGVLAASGFLYLTGHMARFTAAMGFFSMTVVGLMHLAFVLRYLGDFSVKFFMERIYRKHYRAFISTNDSNPNSSCHLYAMEPLVTTLDYRLLLAASPKAMRLIFLRAPSSFLEKTLSKWIGNLYVEHAYHDYSCLKKTIDKWHKRSRLYCFIGDIKRSQEIARQINWPLSPISISHQASNGLYNVYFKVD